AKLGRPSLGCRQSPEQLSARKRRRQDLIRARGERLSRRGRSPHDDENGCGRTGVRVSQPTNEPKNVLARSGEIGNDKIAWFPLPGGPSLRDSGAGRRFVSAGLKR